MASAVLVVLVDGYTRTHADCFCSYRTSKTLQPCSCHSCGSVWFVTDTIENGSCYRYDFCSLTSRFTQYDYGLAFYVNRQQLYYPKVVKDENWRNRPVVAAAFLSCSGMHMCAERFKASVMFNLPRNRCQRVNSVGVVIADTLNYSGPGKGRLILLHFNIQPAVGGLTTLRSSR